MSKRNLSPVCMAMSALGMFASGGASAQATATGSVGAYTVTFFDLNLTDNISPTLIWPDSSTNSQSSAFASFASNSFDFSPGAYSPTTGSVSGTLGSATASTGAFFGTSTVILLGSSANGSNTNIQSNAYAINASNVTIAPWTGLIISAPFTATASTTVGLSGNDSEFASASGYIQIFTPLAGGGFNASYAYQQVFASYTFDGNTVSPQTSSFTGTISMTFANLSDFAITDAFFTVYSFAYAGSTIAAIPEPQSVLMLLAGLGGVALITRRRSANR